MDHLCYLCLVFFMLSRLFIAALWSPAGKGQTSWLLFVMFKCVLVTFSCGILGQVWYLIVSIPDLCRLSYLDKQCRPRTGPSLFVIIRLAFCEFPSLITNILVENRKREVFEILEQLPYNQFEKAMKCICYMYVIKCLNKFIW